MTDKLTDNHPDVLAAKEKYLSAQKALGKDLGGFSVVDLLADNFTDWPLTKCKEVAAILKAMNESVSFNLLKEIAEENDEEAADENNDEAETSDETEDSEASDEDEEQAEDVGSVAKREGYEKSKKEIFAFGKTRPATLLTKNVRVGGLDVTEQYVINPKTGEWSFRVALEGQSEASMKEHTTGKDPSSLAKHLQKKNKVTAHWLADNLDPPADANIQDDDDEGLDKEYAKDGVPNEEDQDAIRSHRSTKGVHKEENLDEATESVIAEGAHNWGRSFPVDKFPTLASVKKYINDNVEFDNDDPYSDSHQLKKIGVKQYHTGEKSRNKIENALLDKAQKWEDLLADKFKDENGKEFWIVAGWLAESHMYDKDDGFTKKILASSGHHGTVKRLDMDGKVRDVKVFVPED